MDREPMNEHPQHESRPQGESAPPPPRPAPAYAAGPPPGYYVVPPVPPRRPPWIWRFLSGLLRLIGILLLILIIGSVLLALLGGSLSGFAVGDRIGLVRIEGEISQGEDKQGWIEALQTMGENSHVKGVVVRIDSPGGTVAASQELYGAILRLRNQHKKPVFVSMGDVAASGGYYTASAADRIYALKGTLTGSIGVIFSKPDVASLAQKVGVQLETVKSGRFKDAGDFMRPMTPEEKEFFNALIQNTYGQFIGDVLAWRKDALAKALQKFTPGQWTAYRFTQPAQVTPEAFLRQIADGRVYTGEQALQLGLIDEFGSLEDVEAALGKKVGLGGQPTIQEVSQRRGIGQLFRTEVGRFLPASRSPLQFKMNLP
jgi:protease-4